MARATSAAQRSAARTFTDGGKGKMAWLPRPAVWRHGARSRRLAAMGGRDLRSQPIEPRIEPFAPPAVNEQIAQQEIEKLVVGLAPGGVDEATGHSLDNLINAWADQWIAEVTAQHAWYVARTVPEQMLSEAMTSQVGVLLAHDRSVLGHTVVGVESALLRLVGLGRGASGPASGRRRRRLWPWRSPRRPEDHQDDSEIFAGHGDESGGPWETAADGDGRHGPGTAGQPDTGTAPGSDGPARARHRASAPGEPDTAAAPPDPDPADLGILLGPPHRRRFALWGDLGFCDATLLGGRSRMAYVHLLALLVAAGADVGAFSQIVEQVMSQQSAWLVWVVVVGFTGVVLYIAHAGGTMLRERKAGARWIPWAGAVLCVLIWAALGATAFWLRLHIAPQSAGSVSLSLTNPSSGPTENKQYNATLFLALYAGTGLVAGVGAYLSHNPLRDGYVAALRGYRNATERLAATRFRAEAESARLLAYQAEFDAAAKTLAEEIAKRRALAGKLKEVTRVLIAQRLQDPAATDAMFKDDWRPYP